MERATSAPSAPGSSPLARGLHGMLSAKRPILRIIPARAGFTEHPIHRRVDGEDHPRSRGVYAADTAVKIVSAGSSPLARGLQKMDMPGRTVLRIIPARAGFTYSARESAPTVRDHPRSRGVYVTLAPELIGPPGSSPLARGLPGSRVRVPAERRIIPARAGFTS